MEAALVTSVGFREVRGLPGGSRAGAELRSNRKPIALANRAHADRRRRADVMVGEMRENARSSWYRHGREQSAHRVEVEAPHDGVWGVAVPAVMDVDLFQRRHRLMEDWVAYLTG